MKTNILQFSNIYHCITIFILSSSILNAQIVYTDITPDIVLESQDSESYDIDINQDGVSNFSIDHMYYNPTHFVELTSTGANDQALEGVANHPMAFNKDDLVGANQATWSQVSWAYMFQTDDTDCNWGGAEDQYLGIRIQLNGQWHYGWVRVNVPEDGSSVTIMDFAYNSTPNEAINAGDIGTSAVKEENTNTSITVCPNPNNGIFLLDVQNANVNTSVEIYDMFGRMIYKKPYNNTNIIDLASYSKGIYLIYVNSGEMIIQNRIIIR